MAGAGGKKNKKDSSSKVDLLDKEKFIILELEAQLVGSICWIFDRLKSHEPLDPDILRRNQASSPDTAQAALNYGLKPPPIIAELVTVSVDGIGLSTKKAMDENSRVFDADGDLINFQFVELDQSQLSKKGNSQ